MVDHPEYNTNESNCCRVCGHRLPLGTPVNGSEGPSAGDLSICVGCGTLSVFNADLSLREPTPEELARVSPSMQRAIRKAQAMIARGPKKQPN